MWVSECIYIVCVYIYKLAHEQSLEIFSFFSSFTLFIRETEEYDIVAGHV